MIVVDACDEIGGDASLGERGGHPRRKADGLEAGMNAQGDPRPAASRPDDGDAFILPDRCERVPRKLVLGRRLERILRVGEARFETGDQPAEIGLAGQSSFLRSRLAAIRSRSAFSRMKPAASRWS